MCPQSNTPSGVLAIGMAPDYRCCVYAIFNPQRGAIYIGSTINGSRRRWREHYRELQSNRHKNPRLQHAWSKYGEGAFRWVVLEIVGDGEVLREREEWWLDTFRLAGTHCYNVLSPVYLSLGRRASAATRQKMADASRKQVVTEATKRKLAAIAREQMADPDAMAKLQAGRESFFADAEKSAAFAERQRQRWSDPALRTRASAAYREREFSHSEETKQRIGAAFRGKPVSDAARQKAGEARRESWRDPAQRQKLSDSLKRAWQDPEIRARHLAGQAERRKNGYPGFIAPDGTVYTRIMSLPAFCAEHDLGVSSMRKLAHGHTAQYRGWKRLE